MPNRQSRIDLHPSFTGRLQVPIHGGHQAFDSSCPVQKRARVERHVMQDPGHKGLCLSRQLVELIGPGPKRDVSLTPWRSPRTPALHRVSAFPQDCTAWIYWLRFCISARSNRGAELKNERIRKPRVGSVAFPSRQAFEGFPRLESSNPSMPCAISIQRLRPRGNSLRSNRSLVCGYAERVCRILEQVAGSLVNGLPDRSSFMT